MSDESPRQVVEKVVCPECDRFLGLITDDGQGPIFETCEAQRGTKEHYDPAVGELVAAGQYEAAAELASKLGGRQVCPMLAKLAQYQRRAQGPKKRGRPPGRPPGKSSKADRGDEDAGSDQANAKQATEDE